MHIRFMIDAIASKATGRLCNDRAMAIARLARLSLGIGLLAMVPACGPGAMTVHTVADHPSEGIVVSGQGEASGPPDVASVQLGASVLVASASDAVRMVAARSASIISALSSLGIERKDIQTAQYEVTPQLGREPDSARVTGYRATQVFQVTLNKPEQAGEAIDAASRAAGDAFISRGITFGLKRRDTKVEEARQSAWTDAYAKAVQLARLAGVRLGPPEFVEETVDGFGPRPMLAAREAFNSVSTPVSLGQVRIEVNLRVRFSVPSAAPAGAVTPPSPRGSNVEVLKPR